MDQPSSNPTPLPPLIEPVEIRTQVSRHARPATWEPPMDQPSSNPTPLPR
ncbi:hypothetical protein H4V99_000177 [Cryobacterium sp. CG_9.6]|nr:hypothetical protein [Cryobacterium sp. CG_9.6]